MNKSPESILQENSAAFGRLEKDYVDRMLDDSLAMTPWERILANDDMVNFGDSLRTAMERRDAESSGRKF